MYKTVLQVPMATDLRKQGEKEALNQGFSSLQEFVRLTVRKLADKEMRVRVEEEEVVQLSPRAIKRYGKIIKDIESGKEKVYAAKDVNDLMKQLLQ